MRSLNRLYAAATTAAVIASFSAAAGADVVYDGGAPDRGGVYYGDRNSLVTEVAVPFQLATGATTVTDVHWWGGCFMGPDCPSPADFILNFYADSAGLPGALIQSYSVGNANQNATGNLLGNFFTEYSYSTFISPIVLAASTQYWLGISNATDPANGTWGLETTSDTPPLPFQTQFSQEFCGGWCDTFPQPLAFNLTNDIRAVPEPVTLALLGVGLAGLGFSRRRQ